MIDKWDIAKLKEWLKLAQTKGTDAIKIVAGDEPQSYVVKIKLDLTKER